MKLPRGAVLAAVLALLTISPALADPPSEFTGNGLTSKMSDAGSGSLDSPQATHPQLETCEQLMERAFYLDDPTSPDRAADARREMELARDAFYQGDEFTCTRHAIHALEDRT